VVNLCDYYPATPYIFSQVNHSKAYTAAALVSNYNDAAYSYVVRLCAWTLDNS
jgi:hypothetical protein